ncbi:hypothetical protein Tb927.6.3080 [Trypanosoma brucei brucei TREU927]|uniref:T. brucei spp.-specific protein n=1 Tax=Trypanosoma brucei brucei (strain 927/4 GUTat10.1) TaxID=185431 RepID=Q583M6_TRYB2|nr:hypothetical protein Tb927.6.3080 [Trypanosoma brucei brucei TREU927]AAX81011.1 hypothetical protein Tb927.6.3080 [Trypanosoma brucei]AAZ11870.1 hypothetical protein Tb927.6.3080 [Trypanosoma brucei brucei TREU927]
MPVTSFNNRHSIVDEATAAFMLCATEVKRMWGEQSFIAKLCAILMKHWRTRRCMLFLVAWIAFMGCCYGLRSRLKRLLLFSTDQADEEKDFPEEGTISEGSCSVCENQCIEVGENSFSDVLYGSEWPRFEGAIPNEKVKSLLGDDFDPTDQFDATFNHFLASQSGRCDGDDTEECGSKRESGE